ncbi:hypothetical protein FACS1894125_5810 [Actinomycetota bacterium]|nr:hypothetical protein FACS1894125_5810 [Actinomycetota bacterium]
MEEMRKRIVEEFENSINEWGLLFKDVANGADIVRWKKRAFEDLGPTFLFGDSYGSNRTSGILESFDDGEKILLSFPVFLDDNAVGSKEYSSIETKLKYKGKPQDGIIILTDSRLIIGWEAANYSRQNRYVNITDIVDINEVKFKFHFFVSCTSAGVGYEIVTNNVEDRLLFRVAVREKDEVFKERFFEYILAEKGGNSYEF